MFLNAGVKIQITWR